MQRAVANEEGVRAVLDLAPSFAGEAAPTIDVSKLPGARVVGRLHGADEGATIDAGCVRAPSDRFVPGIESVLFERATALALRTSSAMDARLVVTDEREIEPGLVLSQRSGPSGERTVTLRHLLTFVGKDRDALLCSVSCVESEGQKACAAAVGSFAIEGPHMGPPEPGWLARSLFWSVDHAEIAAGVGAMAVLLGVIWILWRRPRGRRRGQAGWRGI